MVLGFWVFLPRRHNREGRAEAGGARLGSAPHASPPLQCGGERVGCIPPKPQGAGCRLSSSWRFIF